MCVFFWLLHECSTWLAFNRSYLLSEDEFKISTALKFNSSPLKLKRANIPLEQIHENRSHTDFDLFTNIHMVQYLSYYWLIIVPSKNHNPWTWMVGIPSFPLGKPYFDFTMLVSGRYRPRDLKRSLARQCNVPKRPWSRSLEMVNMVTCFRRMKVMKSWDFFRGTFFWFGWFGGIEGIEGISVPPC